MERNCTEQETLHSFPCFSPGGWSCSLFLPVKYLRGRNLEFMTIKCNRKRNGASCEVFSECFAVKTMFSADKPVSVCGWHLCNFLRVERRRKNSIARVSLHETRQTRCFFFGDATGWSDFFCFPLNLGRRVRYGSLKSLLSRCEKERDKKKLQQKQQIVSLR